jgi:hypothetical protein
MRLPSRLQAQHGHAINRLASGVVLRLGSPHAFPGHSPRQHDQPMNASCTVRLAAIGTMVRDDCDDDQRETDDHTWT